MAKKNKQESAAVDNAKKRAKKEKEKKDLQDNKIQNVFGHPVRNMIITAVVSILLGVAFIIKPYEVSQYCGYGVGGQTWLAFAPLAETDDGVGRVAEVIDGNVGDLFDGRLEIYSRLRRRATFGLLEGNAAEAFGVARR